MIGQKQFLAIFIILFSLTLNKTYCQEKEKAKKVSVVNNLSIQNLTHQLIKDCNSNEEKINKIYIWITNNIKYDVGQWLGFNNHQSSIQRILFRKKGSANDFAYLFNEMCRYASVPSIFIKGYLKNEYTDLDHQFYSSDHSWNAVYLNKEWRLFDVCLDAGDIAYYKRTFSGYFIYFFSMGASDRLVYKPHFEQKAEKTYYNKNGYYFKTDHLALNPIWQLTYQIDSVKTFEKDSSFYLSKFDTISSDTSSLLNEHRWSYYQKKQHDKTIEDGFSGYPLNKKNISALAKSYLLKAKSYSDTVTNESILTEEIKSNLNKSIDWLELAKTYSDSITANFKVQKDSLVTNSKEKRNINKEKNKALIQSSNRSIKVVNSNKSYTLGSKKNIQYILIQLGQNKKHTAKQKKYKQTNFSSKTNTTDSSLFAQQLAFKEDIIDSMKHHINAELNNLTTLNQTNIQILDTLSKTLTQNIRIEKEINDLRLEFYDDLDLKVIEKKDSINLTKFKIDSMLLDSTYKNIFNKEVKLSAALKKHLSSLYKLYNSHEKLMVSHKKANQTNLKIDSLNTLFKESTIDYFTTLEEQLKNYKKSTKETATKMESIIPSNEREAYLYLKETYIESQLYTIRGFFIGKYIKSHITEAKKIKKESSQEIKRIEKVLK